jgi:hypothetical protein
MKTKGRRQSDRVQDLRGGEGYDATKDPRSRRRAQLLPVRSKEGSAISSLRRSAENFKPSDKKPRLGRNSKTNRLPKKKS